MERKDLVARKSRSMAMFRAAEAPLAKGAWEGKKCLSGQKNMAKTRDLFFLDGEKRDHFKGLHMLS